MGIEYMLSEKRSWGEDRNDEWRQRVTPAKFMGNTIAVSLSLENNPLRLDV